MTVWQKTFTALSSAPCTGQTLLLFTKKGCEASTRVKFLEWNAKKSIQHKSMYKHIDINYILIYMYTSITVTFSEKIDLFGNRQILTLIKYSGLVWKKNSVAENIWSNDLQLGNSITVQLWVEIANNCTATVYDNFAIHYILDERKQIDQEVQFKATLVDTRRIYLENSLPNHNCGSNTIHSQKQYTV
jgi:hypothetical protein